MAHMAMRLQFLGQSTSANTTSTSFYLVLPRPLGRKVRLLEGLDEFATQKNSNNDAVDECR